tara:strand:- start:1206 stop:1433 length:228 start_codon:yes stop_codon:yes gene_type:complete
MSTDLRTTNEEFSMTRFWAGLEQKVQVTMRRDRTNLGDLSASDKIFTSLQLTRDEARELALDLFKFAQGQEQEDV